MSLYQKMLVFYAVMAALTFLITWFLSHDKKRIRFLSAFLGGSDLAYELPGRIAVFAVLTRLNRRAVMHLLPVIVPHSTACSARFYPLASLHVDG